MDNIDISANGQWSLEKSIDEQNQEVIEKSVPELEQCEMIKVHENGQWSLDKAVNTLDYGKINQVKQKPASPSLDYAAMTPKPDHAAIEAAAPTIDYGKVNDPKTQKPTWKQTSTDATRKEAWMKVNRARNELAARGIKKD